MNITESERTEFEETKNFTLADVLSYRIPREWEKTGIENWNYRCPKCGGVAIVATPFCSKCGQRLVYVIE